MASGVTVRLSFQHASSRRGSRPVSPVVLAQAHWCPGNLSCVLAKRCFAFETSVMANAGLEISDTETRRHIRRPRAGGDPFPVKKGDHIERFFRGPRLREDDCEDFSGHQCAKAGTFWPFGGCFSRHRLGRGPHPLEGDGLGVWFKHHHNPSSRRRAGPIPRASRYIGFAINGSTGIIPNSESDGPAAWVPPSGGMTKGEGVARLGLAP